MIVRWQLTQRFHVPYKPVCPIFGWDQVKTFAVGEFETLRSLKNNQSLRISHLNNLRTEPTRAQGPVTAARFVDDRLEGAMALVFRVCRRIRNDSHRFHPIGMFVVVERVIHVLDPNDGERMHTDIVVK